MWAWKRHRQSFTTTNYLQYICSNMKWSGIILIWVNHHILQELHGQSDIHDGEGFYHTTLYYRITASFTDQALHNLIYHIVQQDGEGCLHVHSYTLHHTIAPQYYIQCSKFSCSVKCSSTWSSPQYECSTFHQVVFTTSSLPMLHGWRGVPLYGPLLIGSQPLSLSRYCTVSSRAAKWSIFISTLYITVTLFH